MRSVVIPVLALAALSCSEANRAADSEACSDAQVIANFKKAIEADLDVNNLRFSVDRSGVDIKVRGTFIELIPGFQPDGVIDARTCAVKNVDWR